MSLVEECACSFCEESDSIRTGSLNGRHPYHILQCFQLLMFNFYVPVENPGTMARAEGKESGVNRKGKENNQILKVCLN